MTDNGGVRISNREIYDSVQALTDEVRAANANMNLRVTRLEERANRGWQFWTALTASPVFGAALAWQGIKTGAS